MKKKWISLYNGVLTAGLAALGFTSCDGIGNGAEEYGTPTVGYHVVGQVTDEAGNPIRGIKVTIAEIFGQHPEGIGKVDSIYTDAAGKYESKALTSITLDKVNVIMEDVDGEANGGTFANDTVKNEQIQRKQIKKGDGHWLQGIFELTADKKLKKIK